MRIKTIKKSEPSDSESKKDENKEKYPWDSKRLDSSNGNKLKKHRKIIYGKNIQKTVVIL